MLRILRLLTLVAALVTGLTPAAVHGGPMRVGAEHCRTVLETGGKGGHVHGNHARGSERSADSSAAETAPQVALSHDCLCAIVGTLPIPMPAIGRGRPGRTADWPLASPLSGIDRVPEPPPPRRLVHA